MYSQHNDVIGALGVHLRLELDEYANQLLAPAPMQWDSSAALAALPFHRTSAPWSSLTLVLVPQLPALTADAVYGRPQAYVRSSSLVGCGRQLGASGIPL